MSCLLAAVVEAETILVFILFGKTSVAANVEQISLTNQQHQQYICTHNILGLK